MSEIITNKLTGKTSAGDVTITSEGGSATLQLQQGVIKCWADINSLQDSVPDSFNVASISDDATGIATLNYTNTMGNSDYSANGTCASGGSTNRGCVVSNKTTSLVQCKVGFTSSDSPNDYHQDWQVIGDLA